MGRPLRNEDPEIVYHVSALGSNREAIYLDDDDRRMFTQLLARFAHRQRWVVLAWVLMTNHYHLLVRAPSGGLSRGMQLLNSSYARRFNERHSRSAHVFRNRFTATPIRSEAHLLEACRYIVLNPVRAGLCRSAAAWRWSSHRACAGLDLAPPFLAESTVLGLFDTRPGAARRAYREFVGQGHVSVSDTRENAGNWAPRESARR